MSDGVGNIVNVLVGVGAIVSDGMGAIVGDWAAFVGTGLWLGPLESFGFDGPEEGAPEGAAGATPLEGVDEEVDSSPPVAAEGLGAGVVSPCVGASLVSASGSVSEESLLQPARASATMTSATRAMGLDPVRGLAGDCRRTVVTMSSTHLSWKPWDGGSGAEHCRLIQ